MVFDYFASTNTIDQDDLNGSVGSIADLKPKAPGFEFWINQGFFLM
jgi:hypothetical protein